MADVPKSTVPRPVLGYFSTVHVKGEAEGEIEPEFYKEFKEDLGKMWTLYDFRGSRLRFFVEFNDDDGIPRLRLGWRLIRELLGLQGNHTILFKYYGANTFEISVNMKPIYPTEFPTWHTKSRSLRKATTFRVTITDDPEVNPSLALPYEMAEYMWHTMLDKVTLVGQTGEKHTCDLDFQEYPFMGAISSGWPEVFGINDFHVGDTIMFNIVNIYDNHMIHVRKV